MGFLLEESMISKAIITAAITGPIHTPTMSSYLPITPDEIADEAIRACEAGAAVAHIHVRDPETGQPSADMRLFEQVITKVKNRCNMIICSSTGGGLGMVTPEQRVRVVPTFKPELASFNMGSLNFNIFPLSQKMKEFKYAWEKDYLESTEDLIFPNTFRSMKIFINIFKEHHTKPELEIYDTGMIDNVAYLLDQGFLKKPLYIQFVLGILGGLSASIENLVFLHDSARRRIGEGNFVWSVCAAGRNQMPMCTMALLMGGNARVGLEDSLWLGKGVLAKSNADQVEKIIRIGREFGIEPATPDEARKILEIHRNEVSIPK